MPDGPFVISPSAPPPPTEADYEAIHAAVMETVRGRWFLSEYAKRNRHADTSLILAAIDRVEALWRERGAAPSPVARVHFDLVEMAKAIAQTRSEIAAIKPDGEAKGSLSEASEELDSIVHTTEKATSDILAAAEQVQEIAWTLREHGADATSCDALDQRATEIYSACSFQDLTGQRTRKVVEVLRFLEDRIRAMIEIWGNAGPAPAESVPAPHLGRDEASQLAQPEIDRIIPAPAERAAAATAAVASAHAESATEIETEAPIESPIDTHAPVDGMVHAVAAQVVAVGSDAAIAETVLAAPSHDLPGAAAPDDAPPVNAAAVIGATALALEPAPVEAAPEADMVHEAAAAPRAQADFQVEPQAAIQAEPQSALKVEPPIESPIESPIELQAEPPAAPSPAVAPAADDEFSDPAAMLKRILALIRTPNGASLEVNVVDPPAGASADAGAPPGLVMTLAVTEPPAAAEATPVTAPSSAVAALMVAEPPVADAPVAAAPVAETPVVAAAIAGAAPAVTYALATNAVAPNVFKEAINEILKPLSGPLTVDQAVSDLLGNGPMRAGPMPLEPVMPTAAAHAEAPFALAVPELTIAPVPVAPAPAEPVPLEPASPFVAAAPAAPEPLPPEPVRAEATAPPVDQLIAAPAPPDEPPAPIAATIANTAPPDAAAETTAAAAPAPEPAAKADTMPVVTATFRQTAQPISPALRPLLAAIAALSDEEKLALFS